MKKKRPLPISTAVAAVLDYLYEAEKAHYQNSSPQERAGHIFLALERLQEWLYGDQVPTRSPSPQTYPARRS